MNLTHLDKNNRPKMVDLSNKENTTRIAIASGLISMSQKAFNNIISNNNKKGPVIQTAVISAIMGTKKTSELIPMCHPVLLSWINCDVNQLDELPGFKLTVTTKLSGQTGVEMEALTCSTVVALTIYDMCKAIDKSIELGPFYLLEKSGGKSGVFKRQ